MLHFADLGLLQKPETRSGGDELAKNGDSRWVGGKKFSLISLENVININDSN